MEKIVSLPVGELKLALVIVLSVHVVSMSSPVSKAQIPEWIQRRQSNDFYNYSNSSGSKPFVCDDKNISITYLVDEKRCVANQEVLFGGN